MGHSAERICEAPLHILGQEDNKHFHQALVKSEV
jgi:hypothetical protein